MLLKILLVMFYAESGWQGREKILNPVSSILLAFSLYLIFVDFNFFIFSAYHFVSLPESLQQWDRHVIILMSAYRLYALTEHFHSMQKYPCPIWGNVSTDIEDVCVFIYILCVHEEGNWNLKKCAHPPLVH